MNSQDFKRKLSAVFSADVAGYSRLMGEDEAATVKTLEDYKQVMFSLVKQHGGRVVDSPGDNVLAEFPSVVDAVECAAETQKELRSRNDGLPKNRRMEFRIGINLGDVIEKGERIYGDGVNIAARIESLAEAGGICISGSAHEQVEQKLPLNYEDMGSHKVKNVIRPVHVYKVSEDLASTGRPVKEEHEPMTMPSIAVMPFVNLSGDSEQDYFSNGITEEIITSLSKTPKMLVIDRGSTFAYKGKDVDLGQVGQELAVQYILTGSVRKAGDRVRVNAQLIHAGRGEHLWAERYDREMKDIFALQDEITLRITQALQIKLTEGEQARIFGKGTNNLDAYLKWLQGQDLLIRGNKDDNALARRMFEDAIRSDPNWVQPYVLLGFTCLMESLSGWSSSPESAFNEAVKLGRKSLTLDDSLPGPHGLMSQIHLYKRRHDEAIAEAQKAVTLGAGLAFVYEWLGSALIYAGRSDEAIRFLEKAIRLNPFPPPYWVRNLGEAYRMTKQYKEAITEFKRAMQGNPHYLEGHVSLACTYSLMGRDAEARAVASEVLRVAPGFSIEDYARTLPYKEENDLNCVTEALRKAGLR
ncbi:MAG: adenylate/guanylate cyclase domain-containing protein [Desulfobacterota bacterium]|jgi:adenylate cyclase|nr:adenylate/guanylate cyclase domain-containing protein [Thermodesulfobacteriota bacterium]